MKILLPHHYKRIGLIILPLGLCLWLAMQFGYINSFLVYFFGHPDQDSYWSAFHVINVLTAIIGFFTFLSGLYFLSFSKEKVEDEMVQKTRLDSFQFAAFLQIIIVIAGFLFVLFSGDQGEGGMLMFFIVLVSLFWLTFITRFNYILHVKLK